MPDSDVRNNGHYHHMSANKSNRTGRHQDHRFTHKDMQSAVKVAVTDRSQAHLFRTTQQCSFRFGYKDENFESRQHTESNARHPSQKKSIDEARSRTALL